MGSVKRTMDINTDNPIKTYHGEIVLSIPRN
jgi:hypothetical protein